VCVGRGLSVLITLIFPRNWSAFSSPEDFWTRSVTVKRKEVTARWWACVCLNDAGKSGGERAWVG
jgi:hypothetical protein